MALGVLEHRQLVPLPLSSFWGQGQNAPDLKPPLTTYTIVMLSHFPCGRLCQKAFNTERGPPKLYPPPTVSHFIPVFLLSPQQSDSPESHSSQRPSLPIHHTSTPTSFQPCVRSCTSKRDNAGIRSGPSSGKSSPTSMGLTPRGTYKREGGRGKRRMWAHIAVCQAHKTPAWAAAPTACSHVLTSSPLSLSLPPSLSFLHSPTPQLLPRRLRPATGAD